MAAAKTRSRLASGWVRSIRRHLKKATPNTAAGSIRDRIDAAGGSLPWAEVMRIALYEPGAGYYRRGVRRIGRGGDFYTAVSVGPAFGELLGLFVERAWRAAGSPREFAIIEQGAHDGTLATDILRGLQHNAPELYRAVHYVIIEPDAAHRATQRETPGVLAEKLSHADHPAALVDVPAGAVFLCNELPDAMPVHRVRFTGGRWSESHVRVAESGGLEFFPAAPSSARLAGELSKIPGAPPEGFVTEVNLAMLDWIRALAAARFNGPVLILDYGHGAEDCFSPAHAGGSLRRYRGHHSDDRVLEDLGECDLTAHVNFTRLAREALDCGMQIVEFIEQGRFLTRLLAESATAGHARRDAAWLRQFQSLTHPGIMGRVFHALVLGKHIDPAGLATPEMTGAARRRLGL
jgi:SAM-dependent MidA family methyltransferase